ncbi:Uncharacterized protein BM_BM8559 [Brugia malayi]|uniref:Bm8559 n=1 Tax=Brugia malayi TaxID=6279 RepID=A0A0H5S1H0_BRUMA|nr:Uncharacterized protein BM_BM8559 [Brugia malayi]CRZ22490.1 Bm8559 [Brugia malayi]VIO87932.1 Uncharacterized protein BM_BM8559 [Brugia malayi]
MGYSQRTHVNAVLAGEAKNQSGHASVVLMVLKAFQDKILDFLYRVQIVTYVYKRAS